MLPTAVLASVAIFAASLAPSSAASSAAAACVIDGVGRGVGATSAEAVAGVSVASTVP